MDCSSFGQSKKELTIEKLVIQNVSSRVSSIDAEKKDYHVLFPPYKEKVFNEVYYGYIQEVYKYLYPKEKLLLLDSI